MLSWLSDTPTFYDDLSLWEHLEFVARLHGVDGMASHVPSDLLEQIGLEQRRDDIPTTFSRGLRQKAAITLAFIRPFKLMLVDEPFVGLDEPGKQALLASVRRGIPARRDPADRHPRAVVREAGRASAGAARRRADLRRRALRHRRAHPRATDLTDNSAKSRQRSRPDVTATGRRGTLRSRSMQEFESISASSYDPSALATKLTAKAADGWSVVAIVPTGGDVTAFLSRDKSAADGREVRRPRHAGARRRNRDERDRPFVTCLPTNSSAPTPRPTGRRTARRSE